MKMKKILFVALSLLLLLAFGCSDDTNNSSVTNPNPNAFKATGSIQGKVLDSCSTLPIKNALVSIGFKKTYTDEQGQWFFKDVPATSYEDTIQIDGNLTLPEFKQDDGHHPPTGITGTYDTGFRGNYSVTIDMAKATINGVKVTNYARFYHEEAEAFYSSMEPTSGIINATNAKVTPVNGLVSGDNDFYLGQMTAGLTGYVVNKDVQTLAGYKVYLLSTYGGPASNTTTGLEGNLVDVPGNPAITDATGKFVFTKIEAKQDYKILVVDTAIDTASYMGFKNVTTPYCGLTASVGMLPVASRDIICPFPLSITADGHANYADIAKEEIADGVNVIFTFSKPIKKTELNTGRGLVATYGYDPESLYGDIAVNYEGYKSSNIYHTLTWNAAMTQLTVNIPAEVLQPASVYTVKIMNNSNLMDAGGKALTNKAGTFLDEYPYYNCESFVEGHLGEVGIKFTTYGSVPAEKVTDLRYYAYQNEEDDAQLDYDDTATLDWTSTTGAKGYNVYCRMIQFDVQEHCVPDPICPECNPDICENTGIVQYHPFYLYGTTPVTGMMLNFQGSNSKWPDGKSNWFEFVENWNVKLSYECFVVSLDADRTESIDPETGLRNESNRVIIEDTDRPHIVSTSAINGTIGSGNSIGGVQVCFSEPMDEYLAQHATWTVNADAFQTGTGVAMTVALQNYDTYSKCFRVHFSDATDAQLISSVRQATCPTTTVDVPVLSLTAGALADVAGNRLQDPSEHSSSTVGRLPVTVNVPCIVSAP